MQLGVATSIATIRRLGGGAPIWPWREGSWVVVDPAPAMRGGFLASSICESRGHCDLAAFGAYCICMDCGDATDMKLDDADESA